MKKCDCYCVEEQVIGWHTPVDPKITIVYKCNGTRERDACSCGGDRTKCDFYPKIREKALKEQEVKFGKWINVKDRLPNKEGYYICALRDDIVKPYVLRVQFCNGRFIISEWHEKNTGRRVTHWMPLPTPPTEKENSNENK